MKRTETLTAKQRKAIGKERLENFQSSWLGRFREKFKGRVEFNEQYTRYTFQTDQGELVDFYPKANKVIIQKTNKDVKPGLKYLINKYLK